MTRPPTTTTDWRDAIDSFSHDGPGGDEALAAQHPDLVAALHKLGPDDEPVQIGRDSVTRQTEWGRGASGTTETLSHHGS